jgi:hypothetical protein
MASFKLVSRTRLSMLLSRGVIGMADIRRQYMQAMRRLWGSGYWITWQPNTRLQLGDVGALINNQLIIVDNLAARGIKFSTVVANVRDELVYDSNGHASVSMKLAGQIDPVFAALTLAEAGAKVSFGTDASVFVALVGVRETRMASVPDLTAEIVAQYWKGWWQPEYVVITHLVQARAGTILVAAEQGSSVEFRARSGVGVDQLRLADLATSVQVAHSRGLGYQLVCHDTLTPFSHAIGLKRSFLNELRTHYPRQAFESASDPPAELLRSVASLPETVDDDLPQPWLFAPRQQ